MRRPLWCLRVKGRRFPRPEGSSQAPYSLAHERGAFRAAIGWCRVGARRFGKKRTIGRHKEAVSSGRPSRLRPTGAAARVRSSFSFLVLPVR